MVYLIIIKIWFTALSRTGECLHRPDCVGVRSSIPASICTLTSESSAEPIETDDLWLVVNELERFEGRFTKCIKKYYISRIIVRSAALCVCGIQI